MKNQKGIAGLLVLALIVVSFGIGVIFEKATDHVDHPIEQAAEKVLARHGIEVDFSKDKKDKLTHK